jgi:hypothetical protein
MTATTTSFRNRPPGGTSGNGTGMRVAPAKPRRNTALIAVGVLLMVVFGLVATVLQLKAANRTSVLAVARPVPVGQTIQAADLVQARISTDPSLRTIPASEASRVVGHSAGVALVPGSLLTQGELADSTTLTKGKVVVGLNLKPGQVPTSSLKPGDQVLVVATGQAADAVTGAASTPGAGAQTPHGAVLVRQATVYGVDGPSKNGDNNTSVSVVVDEGDAPSIAGAGSAGLVTLVLRTAS